MGMFQRGADNVYALRFLRLLTMPWEKTEAYKQGIIDDKGNILKRPRELKNSDEKAAYTYFHRLVFNIRRLIEKLPINNKLSNYASALFLVKEETKLSDEQIISVLNTFFTKLDTENALFENAWMINKNNQLLPGQYTLTKNCPLLKTGECFAQKGNKINIQDVANPVGYFNDIPLYEAIHINTNQKIIISTSDIKK